eukprot:12802310-Ditylum_brightwellii.AAC.1
MMHEIDIKSIIPRKQQQQIESPSHSKLCVFEGLGTKQQCIVTSHQSSISIFKSHGREATATYPCMLPSKTALLKRILTLMACRRLILWKVLLLGMGTEYGSA